MLDEVSEPLTGISLSSGPVAISVPAEEPAVVGVPAALVPTADQPEAEPH